MGRFGKKSEEKCRNRKVWDEKGQKGIFLLLVERCGGFAVASLLPKQA